MACRTNEGDHETVILYSGKDGALDVRGSELRVGNSGAACTKGNEGAVRYAKPDLEFCDGEGWRALNVAKLQRLREFSRPLRGPECCSISAAFDRAAAEFP